MNHLLASYAACIIIGVLLGATLATQLHALLTPRRQDQNKGGGGGLTWRAGPQTYQLTPSNKLAQKSPL
mgnify:CR=1 FL=1